MNKITIQNCSNLWKQFIFVSKSTKLTENYLILLILVYFIFLVSKFISISSFSFILFASIVLSIVVAKSIIPIIIITLIFTLDYFISINIIDFSSDGVTYHYDAMRRIANDLYLTFSGDKRIDSYPALPWLIGATPIIFSKIASGDGIINLNTFGKIGSALILFIYSYNQLEPIGKKRLYIALLLAFPPIFWSQFLTGYQDYFTYLFAAYSVVSLFLIIEFNKIEEQLPVLFLSLCLAGLVKYQGALYVILFVPILFGCLWKKYNLFYQYLNKKKIFYISITVISALSISIFLYLNLLNYGRIVPFTSDVSTPNILFDNPFYSATPGWIHFIHSIFSSPMINPESHKLGLGVPNLKEILYYGYPDLRFGAYAPLTGFLIIILLLINLKKIFVTPFSLVSLYILIILLFAPGIGVARYYSFIQLIPPVLLLWIYNDSYFKFLSRVFFISYLTVAIGAILSYQIKLSNYQSFANEIKDKNLSIKFNGWEYHKYVLEEKFLVKFNTDQIPNNINCKSLITAFPNLALNDEILICD